MMRIRSATNDIARLHQLCADYLIAHPDIDSPPAVLLRQLACAGRNLVLAVGCHVVCSDDGTTTPCC